MLLQAFFILLNSPRIISAAPVSTEGNPQPGQSSYYSTYRGKTDAYPANITKGSILPTSTGVERFNSSAFTAGGFPNTTYDRIIEIRDNEAGHLAIFQQQISTVSIKPGACEYIFPYTDAVSYLELGTFLEVSSMAFLTGLVLQAQLDNSKSALVAIAETESRHNTWSLIDVWNANPFAGPADTVFPYANEILESTNAFIVPGSCPVQNPPYPSPSQKLPPLGNAGNVSLEQPGQTINFTYPDESNQPKFLNGTDYFWVAFHGVGNASAPYNVATASGVIPENIEAHKGIVIFVIADAPGAPSLESVVAGPLIVPQV
ncbi:hypothetical protein EK21DRAFT_98574 [Setomelanomma holmii]|uniref:Uncharacterized protein n=1 Tax=Setomelanomma holmii TaxID=210430 RepID=A0A9P4HE88_9PLEO|nr:hypothetical protein EK21DRAFT_98574 [Setomelanomma holmii]